jgi:hypothetical protein
MLVSQFFSNSNFRWSDQHEYKENYWYSKSEDDIIVVHYNCNKMICNDLVTHMFKFSIKSAILWADILKKERCQLSNFRQEIKKGIDRYKNFKAYDQTALL